MEKNYLVYCHTTPSNKKYIGITRQDPEKRWENGKGYVYNTHFYRAIKKYGWNSISHEIIADNLTQEEACENEKKYISIYDTTNPSYGYNLTSGGEKGFQLTEECKKRLSDSHKKLNKDGRNCKRNIGGANAIARPVYQYTLQGVLVSEYDSVASAARFLVLSGNAKKFNTARQCIMRAANHTKCQIGKYKVVYKSAYGYKWAYDKDSCDDINVSIKKRNSQTRPIFQYSKTGKFIRKYDSIKKASDQLGVAQAHITQSARGQRVSAHGYLWAYADTDNIEKFIGDKVKEKMHGGKMWSGGNHRSRRVEQYDFDGNYIQTFSSIADASRALGISPSNISGCAGNKVQKTAGGFIWKYE